MVVESLMVSLCSVAHGGDVSPGASTASEGSRSQPIPVLGYSLHFILFKNFFGVFLLFLGPLLQQMEVPRLGSCSCRPTPQQPQIWATSATFTIADGNTRSLTHWVRPRIKLETSRFLARFVSTSPWQELPILLFKLKKLHLLKVLRLQPTIFNQKKEF